MSTASAVRAAVGRIPRGRLFTVDRLAHFGPVTAVKKELSRLSLEKVIDRPFRGIFVRPQPNRSGGRAAQDVLDVVDLIVKRSGETIQLHGSAAALHFGLAKKAPSCHIFYTNGPSRTIRVFGKHPVRFFHTMSRRRLQEAGTEVGLAISALWYVGQENATPATIARLKARLGPEGFERFRACDLPAWMEEVIDSCTAAPGNG